MEQKIAAGIYTHREKRDLSAHTDWDKVAAELRSTRKTEEAGKKTQWAIYKTQRRHERENRKARGRVLVSWLFCGTSYLTWKLWRVLCCGGGNSSSWTVAKHVSSSVHYSALFLSLSVCPPPTLPHSPSWVLLKLSEQPSAPCPSQRRGGKFHSVKGWWWDSTGSEVPLSVSE